MRQHQSTILSATAVALWGRAACGLLVAAVLAPLVLVAAAGARQPSSAQPAPAAADERSTCLAGPDPRATWAKQDILDNVTTQLQGVFFLNEDIGWAIGSNTILKTEDGGMTPWKRQVSPVPGFFNEVFFLDEKTGWIAGGSSANNGFLLRTVDGGDNWEEEPLVQLKQPPKMISGLYGLWFTDANNGYAVGNSEGSLLFTHDGGTTWGRGSLPQQDPGGPDNMHGVTFTSAGVGHAVGYTGTILRTRDRGETWERRTPPRSQSVGSFKQVAFTDTRQGYAVEEGVPKFHRTDDAGDNWVAQAPCPAPGFGFHGVGFAGGPNCLGRRCNGLIVGDTGTIFGTTDGGDTWIGQPNDTRVKLMAVAYPRHDTAYAVGANGTILKGSIKLLPVVTGMSPAKGTSGGGTKVVIDVQNLQGEDGVDNTRVTFGGVEATVEKVSSTEGTVTVISPPHPPGEVRVQVTTRAGSSSVVPDLRTDVFTYVPSMVEKVSPAKGPLAGGRQVTITGEGFTGALAVRFGEALAQQVRVEGDTVIKATSPPAPRGLPEPVGVTVVNPFGVSEPASEGANVFTYLAPPTVGLLNPPRGPATGGTQVRITGTGFEGATGVLLGDVAVNSFSVDSATQITFAVPPHAPGRVPITVSTPERGASVASPASQFTYHPAISGLFPATGPTTGGTEVTIAGKGLTGATAVRFGADTVALTVVSDSEIRATAPAHAVPEAVPVQVTAAALPSLPEEVFFTYGPPVITDGDGDGNTGGGPVNEETPPVQTAPPGGTGSPAPTPTLSSAPSPLPGGSAAPGASASAGTSAVPGMSGVPGASSSPVQSGAPGQSPVAGVLPAPIPTPLAAPGTAVGQAGPGSGQGAVGSTDADEARGARRYAMADAHAGLGLGVAGAAACFSWLALGRRMSAAKRRWRPTAGRARPKGAY